MDVRFQNCRKRRGVPPLWKNPKFGVEELLSAAVAKVHKPVTVKFRKGFDDDHVNAVEIRKIAESCGVAAVAVHGRTGSSTIPARRTGILSVG